MYLIVQWVLKYQLLDKYSSGKKFDSNSTSGSKCSSRDMASRCLSVCLSVCLPVRLCSECVLRWI